MSSWLFGSSKLNTNQIEDSFEIVEAMPPVTTAIPESVPAMPNLLYNLTPATIPKTSDTGGKPTSMLDNIPFVLSSQLDVTTANYTSTLEDTGKYLLSVKKLIDSGAYNYDFSNELRLVSKC